MESYVKKIGLTPKILSYIQFTVIKKIVEVISYDYRSCCPMIIGVFEWGDHSRARRECSKTGMRDGNSTDKYDSGEKKCQNDNHCFISPNTK